MTNIRRYGVLLCCAACVTWAHAQSKLEGYGGAQAGWSSSGSFLGEGMGGLRYGRWGWGLASGLDQWGVRTVPLLADVRWAILQGGAHRLEIFSQEGWNFAAQAAPDLRGYTGGPYWYGGLSFRAVSVRGAGGLWIHLGAKYKQYKVANIFPYTEPTTPCCAIDLVLPEPATVVTGKAEAVLTLGWGW